MTEGQYTQQLLKDLKELYGPAWTILKHSDRFTSDIPDLSISNNTGRTAWFEVKHFRERTQDLERPHTYVDKPGQLYRCCKLGGYFIVRDPFKNGTLLISAGLLRECYKNDRLEFYVREGFLDFTKNQHKRLLRWIREIV